MNQPDQELQLGIGAQCCAFARVGGLQRDKSVVEREEDIT
jgi:hypothetical protein